MTSAQLLTALCLHALVTLTQSSESVTICMDKALDPMERASGFEPSHASFFRHSWHCRCPSKCPLRGRRAWQSSGHLSQGHQRLTHWNDLLALARPGFLRSTTLASLMRYPAVFRGGRRLGSYSCRALPMPCRSAWAWPVVPPPLTVAFTS